MIIIKERIKNKIETKVCSDLRLSRCMKIILFPLLLILFFLNGCVIPVENRAPHVKRADEYYLSQNNCSQLGFVEGSESMGNTMSHDKERAIQKATNKAGDLGGNVIIIKNISQSAFNTTVEGVVYSCQNSNCSSKEWQNAQEKNTIKSYEIFQTKCGIKNNRFFKLAEKNISDLIIQNKNSANFKKNKKIEGSKAVILRTGVLGDFKKSQLAIIENKFLDEVSNDYDIVPQEEYEKAEEAAFQELDYEECTEEQCIRLIQEMLQVENMFQIQLIREEDNTQVSLVLIDLDRKLVKSDFCENCKTSSLIKTISKLYEDLSAKR